jgi:hypothetical protein
MSIPIEMIDPTTNEAAERLHDLMHEALRLQGEAVAAERRATVERIRAAVPDYVDGEGLVAKVEIDAILDEEAAR